MENTRKEMTDREKLLKMDDIRVKYGIILRDLRIVSSDDILDRFTHTPLTDTAREVADHINCLREMFRIMYDIREVGEETKIEAYNDCPERTASSRCRLTQDDCFGDMPVSKYCPLAGIKESENG